MKNPPRNPTSSESTSSSERNGAADSLERIKKMRSDLSRKSKTLPAGI
jgi:hypothetical protein